MLRSPLVAAALYLCAPPVNAQVQYNLGVVPAFGYHHERAGFDTSVVGALMFGQSDPSDMGFGPRAEIGTFAFETLRVGLGPSLHVPLEPLALGPAAHIAFSAERGASAFGVGGRGFLGLRPYNHIGSYSATGGLVLGVDHWFGAGPSFMVGAQVDAMWLSLPAMALISLLRD